MSDTGGPQTFRWTTVAVLRRVGRSETFPPPTALDLGNGVQLLRAPDNVREKVLQRFPSPDAWKTRYAITEAVLAVTWESGPPQIDFDLSHLPPASGAHRAVTALEQANLAIWLARRSSVGFSLLAHCVKRAEGLHVVTVSHVESLQSNGPEEFLTDEVLPRIQMFNRALAELDNHGPIRLATQLTWRALTTPQWGLRCLLLWIALESLFGPSDHERVKKRLAKRMSGFLRAEPSDAQRLYQLLVRSYADERCRVGHGDGPWLKNRAEISGMLNRIEGWVHESLVSILASPVLRTRFASERESLLQSIEDTK